jgi:hypothetical protein
MRILTWNALGGNTAALAEVLQAKEIDLCVLQEAKVDGDDRWYEPLATIPGYALEPPALENVSRQLPGGRTLHPAEGVIRAYAIVWREETVDDVKLELVDYTKDGYWGPKTPSDPSKAADEGYNQRPPLEIALRSDGRLTSVFTWHAPLGHWNSPCLEMFEESATLAGALRGPTVIAGDLNTTSVAPYFAGFSGLQEAHSRIDYVLADSTCSGVKEIPGIELQAGSHWALAAEVSW